MVDLTKLIELQAAATPGPWEAFTDSYAPTRVLNHKKTICHVIGDSAETDDTAAYIAAAGSFDFAALDEKIKRYEEALKSIAANSCCDSCQEAKLVARKALEQ